MFGSELTCCSYEGDYGSHNQTCDASERLPGLWQVPSKSTGEGGCGRAPLFLRAFTRWPPHGCSVAHDGAGRPVPDGPGLQVRWVLRMLGMLWVLCQPGCAARWSPPPRIPSPHFFAALRRPCCLPSPLLRAVGMEQAANASAFEILKANFLAAYHGNRAPMPLFVHSFFLRAGDNQRDVERFLGAALCTMCPCCVLEGKSVHAHTRLPVRAALAPTDAPFLPPRLQILRSAIHTRMPSPCGS